MIDNPQGNFKFAKGSGPYSSGAAAHDGYEVVHAIFNPLPQLWDAFDIIEGHSEIPEKASERLVRNGVAYSQSALDRGVQ